MSSILLLDDDKDLRALLQSSLTGLGVRVLEAGKLADANRLLANEPVDLVVVDGLLPDGTGLQFIEGLRARDQMVIVVYVTAFFKDLRTFKHLTDDLGVALVAYKPLDAAAVSRRLVGLLAPTLNIEVKAPVPVPPAASPVDELAELRRSFADRLPEKIAEIARAVAAAKIDGAQMMQARQLAHRLRGSAGSYGFPAVGELVGLVEDLLAQGEAPEVATRRFFFEDIEGILRETTAAAAAPEAAVSPTPAERGPAKNTVLVVDDDEDFLTMVRLVARKTLVDVVAVQTSDQALQLASTRPLAAAILDVNLYGEGSFSLAERLRGTVHNAKIPIAFCSVDTRLETQMAAMAAGGTRFLEKPASPESFSQFIHEFIGANTARQGRVLIVDDDADVATTYATHLRRAGMLVEHLASADSLIERLDELNPDMLLLDIELPHVSGIDVCRALRASDRWQMLPILIVTAHTDAETRLRAFRGGASDVIAKPVLPEELLARVVVQHDRQRLIRERADRDALTGLLLRRSFMDACQRALASSMRERKPLSLVLIDVDHFKKVNDEFGHLVGDQVLAGLGELLQRRFRLEDLRARWGGEEFLLAFPGQGPAFAIEAARRLLVDFSSMSFASEDGRSFKSTFTAGVASFPEDGATIAALVLSADERLYAGKRAGRARVEGRALPWSSESAGDDKGVTE